MQCDSNLEFSPARFGDLEWRLLDDSCGVVETRMKLEDDFLDYNTDVFICCPTNIYSPFVRLVSAENIWFFKTIQLKGVLLPINSKDLLASLLAEPESNVTIDKWNAYLNVFKLLLSRFKGNKTTTKKDMNFFLYWQAFESSSVRKAKKNRDKTKTFSSDLVILVLRDFKVGSEDSGGSWACFLDDELLVIPCA